MEQLVVQVLKELKKRISRQYELKEIRVFGSSIRGDRRTDSDIDVFVRLPEVNRQVEEALFDMAYELELEYDCLIDLIVFGESMSRNLIPPIYEKIMTEGAAV